MPVGENQQLVSLDQALAPVKGMLARNLKGIGAALGNYMAPERFCSAVVTLCRINPDLANPNKTEPGSLLLSVLRIAHLQLSPDPALGQAWVIPRNGKAEMQLGYKGAIQLAYRSPLVAAVRYGVVGPKCRFVWEDGREWRLEHEPSEDGWPETLGEVRAAWCIIDLRSGRSIPRVMYAAEILRHKARGKGAQPAWVSDPAAMAAKTVIGDCCRRGPFEGELGRAFAIDHLGEIGKGQPATAEESGILDIEAVTNGEPTNVRSAAERFKAAHRETSPHWIDPNPEPDQQGAESEQAAEIPEEGDPELLQALRDSLGVPAPAVAEEEEAPSGPPLLSPAKVESLSKLAEERKIPPEKLQAECVRIAGTGSLAGLLAEHEPEIFRFIEREGKAPRKR